jgi:S-adenosylmethionine decarboxylase
VKPLGQHLLVDLFECDANAISSLQVVKTSMLEAARRASATIVNTVFHEFNPFGVSGIVVIAVDIFTCGDVLEPKVAADYLAEMFSAGRVSQARLERGVLGPRVAEMPDRLPT